MFFITLLLAPLRVNPLSANLTKCSNTINELFEYV